MPAVVKLELQTDSANGQNMQQLTFTVRES